MREPRATTMPSRRRLLWTPSSHGWRARPTSPGARRPGRSPSFTTGTSSQNQRCQRFTLRIKQKSVAGYANRYRPFFWTVGLKA